MRIDTYTCDRCGAEAKPEQEHPPSRELISYVGDSGEDILDARRERGLGELARAFAVTEIVEPQNLKTASRSKTREIDHDAVAKLLFLEDGVTADDRVGRGRRG